MHSREIVTRRHLPHWYISGAVHFVTYRLAGTIPPTVLQELQVQKEILLRRTPPPGLGPLQFHERVHKQLFAYYDRYLDSNPSLNWLAQPLVAALVRRNLNYHHGGKYHLLAYCVMPNHVHVLLQPIEEALIALSVGGERPASEEKADTNSPLARIMHSLKNYTANEANRLLGRSGPFWQHESYDHWVRDEDELVRIADYIALNPVKAKLVERPHHWFFSSAHDRFLHDGSENGLLWHPS